MEQAEKKPTTLTGVDLSQTASLLLKRKCPLISMVISMFTVRIHFSSKLFQRM